MIPAADQLPTGCRNTKVDWKGQGNDLTIHLIEGRKQLQPQPQL